MITKGFTENIAHPFGQSTEQDCKELHFFNW